jgi:hypothetical protein
MIEIEWDFWLTKPYIYTWQAAALAQGINPKQIKFPTRDAAGELHFDQKNFGDQYSEFRAKLDLLTEHAWIQNFSAQNMRVDLRRFLFWAGQVRKWEMPARMSSLSKSIDLDALNQSAEEKANELRDERNTLQLIWALRLLLKEHPHCKTDRELIYYLSKSYPSRQGFKRLALEMKLAEAQVASDD